MNNSLHTSSKISFQFKQSKDKHLILKFIIKEIEKGTGSTISELKKQYAEDKLFQIGLYYVTTTKKAICSALNIPVEAGCRYKRTLEKQGKLVQSIDEIYCPFTKHLAREISTNPKEFERLQKSTTNQTRLFE